MENAKFHCTTQLCTYGVLWCTITHDEAAGHISMLELDNVIGDDNIVHALNSLETAMCCSEQIACCRFWNLITTISLEIWLGLVTKDLTWICSSKTEDMTWLLKIPTDTSTVGLRSNTIKMALFKDRSLSSKTFILNDLMSSANLGFMFFVLNLGCKLMSIVSPELCPPRYDCFNQPFNESWWWPVCVF